MSISSTQSSYHTDEAPSILNASHPPSQEKVTAIAFDVLCRKKDGSSRNGSADQVRFELKQVSNSPSYTITKVEDKSITIKINNKSYRISVHKQKHHFSYTKNDWEEIADKVKDLIILSNPQDNFLKGTLKLRDRKWTPIFSNKHSQPKIEETTLHNIIKGIKQLFEHEIRPLNPLPSSKKPDTGLISSSSSLPDPLSSRSFPDTQMGSFRKRPSEKESLDQASSSKRRKNSFHTTAAEDSKQTTTKPLSEEKQESVLKKVQDWALGVTDRIFSQKARDTLSHLDLASDTSSLAEEEPFAGSLTAFEYSSDTTSSMEGSLASEDIGASRTVLKDTKGFTL